MNTPARTKWLQDVNISSKTFTLTFDIVERYNAVLYFLV